MWVRSKKKITQFSGVILSCLLLASCMGTRYIEKDQKLLNRQTIKAPKGFSTEGMSSLLVQETNRRLLGIFPIHTAAWIYFQGQKRFNNPPSRMSKERIAARKDKVEAKFNQKIDATDRPTKKSSLQFRKQKRVDALQKRMDNGNIFMQWGEAAAVFDSAKVTASVDRLSNNLFNHGYFLNRVTYETKEFRRRVGVTYNLFPGPQYLYDTIIYQIRDTTVLNYIRNSEDKSLVKPGNGYDQAKLGEERERIDYMLKDLGYFDFSRQYIDFDVDTAYKAPHKIALRMKISNPARRNFHKQFIVDSVSMTPDAGIQIPASVKRFSKVYHGITFNYYYDYYSERILSQRIFITPDSLYSRTKTFNTQRQLANLDVFKFVNVNYDTSGGHFIASIFTSPLDRYSWSNEAGVSLTQGYPGPYYSLSFKKRNIFRGLETLELNGRFGFEGVASATEVGKIYGSTEGNATAAITFPQFLLPIGGAAGYRLGQLNPRTKLLGGYTFSDRFEYRRTTVTISDTYNWENSRKTQYSFTLFNLNIIRSDIKEPDFGDLLEQLYTEQGNNLRNSFRPSFVSSMIFSAIWNPNNYGNAETNSYFIRASAEAGGTLFNFYTPALITNGGLELYKYIRLGADFRRNRVLDKHTVLAFRVNTGVGYSYSDNKTLPYEKFFFAGGSNSVRAWRPRRLGVGSYPPQLSGDPTADGLFDYRFEKPGQVLLESSLELRRKIFGFVNGAIFIDAGNVWSFSETPASTAVTNVAEWTGSTKFKVGEFYKQFGVGTGFGLRFDFTFLILRLDMGIKAYDPGRAPGDRFVLNKFRFWSPYGNLNNPGKKEPVIYNVGIGYPF